MRLASHFAVMPVFALLLAGRRTRLAALVVLAGAIIAISGGGRATIGLFVIGLGITTVLSIRHKATGRQSMVAGVAVVALFFAAPAMLWAINQRSEEALASSDHERTSLESAAMMTMTYGIARER